MNQSLLSPKSDLIFKRIFGNIKNSTILAGFLQSVLDLPPSEYEKLEITDPHLHPDTPEAKLGILDLKLYTKSGHVIDIEIQLLDMEELRERIVFYTSRMITDQINKGEPYSTIKRAISIVITDFVLIEDNQNYHNRYRLYDPKTQSEFTDVLEIDTLELPKLPREQDGSELWEWMRFLKSESEEEISMLAKKNEAIKEAVVVLRELSADERTRMLVEAEEKARRDEISRMRGAESKGKAEGKAEGELKKAKEIAKKMVENALPIETIASMTGLSAEEIEELK